MRSPIPPFLLPALFTTAATAFTPPQHQLLQNQRPLMPGDEPNHQPGVALTDILGTHRSLTTFWSLARLHESTSSLLSDMSVNTTVLAPLNSAIDALPRKPWEDPRDYAEGVDVYEGDDGKERAQRNLRRFVEAHLVTESPWDGGRAKTISGGGAEGEGRVVWWEFRDGKRFIMPDGVEVDTVASQVANGEVWILKGVLNYA